jgi:hypothetical protein
MAPEAAKTEGRSGRHGTEGFSGSRVAPSPRSGSPSVAYTYLNKAWFKQQLKIESAYGGKLSG